MAVQVAQRTRCLSTAPTGQESTSDTSVIRGILCLVPQSEDACPAVTGAEMQYSVRIVCARDLINVGCSILNT